MFFFFFGSVFFLFFFGSELSVKLLSHPALHPPPPPDRCRAEAAVHFVVFCCILWSEEICIFLPLLLFFRYHFFFHLPSFICCRWGVGGWVGGESNQKTGVCLPSHEPNQELQSRVGGACGVEGGGGVVQQSRAQSVAYLFVCCCGAWWCGYCLREERATDPLLFFLQSLFHRHTSNSCTTAATGEGEGGGVVKGQGRTGSSQTVLKGSDRARG